MCIYIWSTLAALVSCLKYKVKNRGSSALEKVKVLKLKSGYGKYMGWIPPFLFPEEPQEALVSTAGQDIPSPTLLTLLQGSRSIWLLQSLCQRLRTSSQWCWWCSRWQLPLWVSVDLLLSSWKLSPFGPENETLVTCARESPYSVPVSEDRPP